MAKIADSFGRLEAFTICIVICVVGYIQEAASKNISTYASAQIFYSTGSTGLQVLQQVFIADTTDLSNRALLSSLPDTPFLVTTWIGSIIGQDIMRTTGSWRWGYGIWAIILPATFLPLALSLLLNQRKAKRLGLAPPSPWKGMKFWARVKSLWFELDAGGILLLSAAIALILIPLTLANTISGGWGNGKIITMLTIGGICLFLFPAWESVPKIAPYPLIPLSLLKSRTFCAGCAIGFFYFCTSPYPPSNNPHPKNHHQLLTITITSGILPLNPTLFLLLPPHNPPSIHHLRLAHNANILLHFHRNSRSNLPHHKMDKPSKILHPPRFTNLPHGHRSHDPVSRTRFLDRSDRWLANRCWDWRWDVECSSAVSCAGEL